MQNEGYLYFHLGLWIETLLDCQFFNPSVGSAHIMPTSRVHKVKSLEVKRILPQVTRLLLYFVPEMDLIQDLLRFPPSSKLLYTDWITWSRSHRWRWFFPSKEIVAQGLCSFSPRGCWDSLNQTGKVIFHTGKTKQINSSWCYVKNLYFKFWEAFQVENPILAMFASSLAVDFSSVLGVKLK